MDKPKSIKGAVERYHQLPGGKPTPEPAPQIQPYSWQGDQSKREGPGKLEQALMWYKGVIDDAVNWATTPNTGPKSIPQAVKRFNELPTKK